MKHLKIWIILTIAALTCITTVNLFGYLYANDTDNGFPEPEKSAISDSIVKGASGFLASNAEAMLLLKEYEVSSYESFNVSNALLKTESALQYLKESRKNFFDAMKTGEKCAYEKTSADKLVNFDYNSFITENKLIGEIADPVAYYLKRGDVIGMYNKNIQNIDEIIELLESIQTSLIKNEKPDITVFWDLLQKFATCKLFGNYMTVLSLNAFQAN